ncbi:hypothetical protein ANN_00305, partial [Periplaneta americana]
LLQLSELKWQIKKVERELVELKKHDISDRRVLQRELKTRRNISNLENRLGVTTEKFNMMVATNGKLREEINHLLKERTYFNKLYQQLVGRFNAGKKMMVDLVEQATLAYDQREEAQNKLRALKDRGKQDLLQQSQEMRELQRRLDHDIKLQDFLGVKGQQRIMADLEAKEAQKRKKKREAAEHLIATYEDILSQIKEFTGECEIDRLTAQFVKQEEENFAIFNYVNELNNEMRPEDVARAVALYDDGRSVRYIASVMNMARSTTHDAIKRHRETLEYTGTRRPGSGRPRATNPNEDRDWRNGQWSCVLFIDESRFNLCSPDGRERVWRRRGERFSQCCISENVPYGGGGVMVWAGVCTDARTELVELLQDQVCELRKKIDDQRDVNNRRALEEQETLARLAYTLAEKRKSADTVANKLEECEALLKKLLDGINRIFHLVRCDNAPILSLLGDNAQVTSYNVMLYLGIIGRRTNDLMSVVYYMEHMDDKPSSLIQEEELTKPHLVRIEEMVPTNPCPLCIEEEELSEVEDKLVLPLSRSDVEQRVKELFAEDGDEFRENLHNVSDCRLPRSRNIMQTRYE